MAMLFGRIDSATAFVLIVFLASIILIDSHDIALPRGDRLGMSGPLVAASIIALGIVPGAAMGLLSTTIIQSIRFVRGAKPSLPEELLVRSGSLLVSSGAYALCTAIDMRSLQVVLVPAAYLTCELVGRQVILSTKGQRSLRSLITGNVFRQRLLFAAQLSVAVLTALIFESMGLWSMIPVVALLLLMRQAYAVLLEIRETYRTTVSVLIDAAESSSPAHHGHAERTAAIARSIASCCGLGPSDIERLNYAALLHDADRIGEAGHSEAGVGRSAALVEGNAFLGEVVPILQVVDGVIAEVVPAGEKDLLSGFIVALASDIDLARRESSSARSEGSAVARIAHLVPAKLKAQAVAAAVKIGYPVPAID